MEKMREGLDIRRRVESFGGYFGAGIANG